MEYTDIVMDHFANPRNVGEIEHADGVGSIGDPSCGDFMRVWITVSEDHHLSNVTFKCKGCAAAIASGSIMTESAIGMHVDLAAETITDEYVDEAAGGLPEVKKHCSNLAASALYKAIMNYVFKG